MAFYVGIDIGGTTSTIAIGAQNRSLIHISEQFPTPSREGPEETISLLVSRVADALRPLAATLEDVITVSLASPGPATLDGVLMPSPNLTHVNWRQFPMRAELEKRFQAHSHAIRVRYIGDGQAAALGEFAVRTGLLDARTCESPRLELPDADDPAMRSLFFVAVGTGLGGGEVRDGLVVRGVNGRAGHAGHLLLPQHAFRFEQDRHIRIGNTVSSAESAVSLTAITHQLNHRLTLPEWRNHPLNQIDLPIKEKAKRLRQLAAEADPLAIELLDDQARALGMVMLMVNYLGDHHLLVIGGGICDMVPQMRERYLGLVKSSYHEHALDGFRDLCDIQYSICGDNASVIGSLAFAYD